MEFHVLGPLQVLDGERPVAITAPRQKSLLAVLLVNANEVVSTDRLLDLVWGDDQPDVSALRYQVSKLREALSDDVVTTQSPGYVVRLGPEQLDALQFEKLLAEARNVAAADAGRAIEVLDQALGLWRGEPYADFAYEEFAAPEIRRLNELRLEAIEARFEALLAQGRDQELVGNLQALVEEHPRREGLTAALMLALYRSGRQADALEVYQALRTELGEGLGLEPSKELVDLEGRMLLQDESLAVEAAPPAADFLRGYILRGRIGEGAHGVVWRAAQPGVGREVAIKAIHPDIANRAGFVRRFEMEAQLVASLEHPHIVSLFDFWRDPEGAYLVMPHLRGGNVAGLMKQGPLRPDAALDLIEAVGSALSYAHRRGVVHRDVTPQNVLLDDDGHPYLADFGVAALVGETAGPSSSSPAYLAPEQHAGRGAVPESDVYSLGMLAHSLLTGVTPDVGAPVAPPSHLSPDVPESVDHVLARATAVDVAERFIDPVDFVDALSGCFNGGSAPPRLLDAVRNPYKGLRAFSEADAPDFFGRDLAVAELVDAVARHRLVAVVGPSGCGKSSLVRAGLLADLRNGVLPGSDRWLVTDMYPGARPLHEFAEALRRVAVEWPEDLHDELAHGDVNRILDRMLPRDSELLLVVDQFEELFTQTVDEAARVQLLDTLRQMATDPGTRCRVVVTLRADFYDRPLEFAGFGDLLRRGVVSVTVPSVESLEQAVIGPAEAVGLTVEPGLERTITRDVADQPGGLPLLEYALTELFHERSDGQLTTAGYHKTGGVLGALGRRAEDLYSAYGDDGRSAAQQVFLRLVTVEEGEEDTRRRIPLTELHHLGIDPDALQRVLDDFGGHRLITFDRDPETREPTVEVAHEALLVRWERLHSWIDERRDDLVLHRRLAAAVNEWEESGNEAPYLLSGGRLEHFEHFAAETDIALTGRERNFLQTSRKADDAATARQRRRRMAILTTITGIALVAVVLAVLASLAQRDAEESRQVAIEQRDRADDAALEAQAQAEVAEQEAARAEREKSVARSRELASSAVLAAETDPLLAMNLAVWAFKKLPDGEEPGLALESALRTAKAANRSAGRFDNLGAGVWTNADVSPDGSTVAVAHGQQLVVFDSATMEEELWSYQEPGPEALGSVAYSSDGEFIVVSVMDERDKAFFGADASAAAGPPDSRLLVFDADSGQLVYTHTVDVEGACGAWAGRGSWRSDLELLGLWVSGCDWDGLAFQFIDTTNWEVAYQHPIPPNDVGGVTFSREGTLAAMFSGYNSEPRSWLIDTADWSIVRELPYPDGTLSPDGEVVVGLYRGPRPVVLEKATTGDLVDRLYIGDNEGWGPTFSPAGDVLAIGTLSDSTLLFDPGTGELIDTIQRIPVIGLVMGENHLYIAGSGVVSKWNTTDVGLGDFNTVPLGLYVGPNSILWTSGGTVVADARDFAGGGWSLYPVDPSTGDLGEPTPYGYAWLTPLPGDRAVMFRLGESPAGEPEEGPLEVVDLSTGEFTVIAGCWMEQEAALAHEPCPSGEPHPAGQIPVQGSRDGTEFMILDLQKTEAGDTEVFASIWDSSSLTETSRVALGVQEGSYFAGALLTDDYIVLHSGRSHPTEVRDRATGEKVYEVAALGNLTEHDRSQNRIWLTGGFDSEVWLLDLDTFEFRQVTEPMADAVAGLATSPSGDLVAVASAGGFVGIYTDEGELRHSIPLPNPSDAWWLDEETLVVGTGNGPWTVITLDPDRLLGVVKDSLQRGFKDSECSLYEIDPCPTLEELRGD